jgi:hypothetical protein
MRPRARATSAALNGQLGCGRAVSQTFGIQQSGHARRPRAAFSRLLPFMGHRLVRRMDMEPGQVPLTARNPSVQTRGMPFPSMSVGSTDKTPQAGTAPARPQGILPAESTVMWRRLLETFRANHLSPMRAFGETRSNDGAGGDTGILIDEERYTSVLSAPLPALTRGWKSSTSRSKRMVGSEFVPKQVWDSQLKSGNGSRIWPSPPDSQRRKHPQIRP